MANSSFQISYKSFRFPGCWKPSFIIRVILLILFLAGQIYLYSTFHISLPGCLVRFVYLAVIKAVNHDYMIDDGGRVCQLNKWH